MKKIIFALFLFTFLANQVLAADFVAPSGEEGNVTLSRNETHRNLYVAGGNVTIEGNTLGDLFAAGGMILINGAIEEDLNVAGGNINLNGQVGSDLRVAGGNIAINSPVAGDVLIGGGNVSLSERAVVGGDLVAGSGNITVNSPVGGDVKIGGGAVLINSRVSGNVEVYASEKLTFGPRSQVVGKIVYKGPQEAEIQTGARIGAIEFSQVEKKKLANSARSFLSVICLIKLISFFLAAWLLIHLWPNKSRNLMNGAHQNFLTNLGAGFLALIITPICAILLFITGIGFVVGLVLLAVYSLLVLLAAIATPLMAGSLLFKWFKKQSKIRLDWVSLLVGVIAMAVIGWIPFAGCLICLVLFTAVLGSLVAQFRAGHKKEAAA